MPAAASSKKTKDSKAKTGPKPVTNPPGRDLKREMAHFSKWLAENASVIKPQGIAIIASIPPADLSKLRNDGDTALTATKMDALIKAGTPYGYKKLVKKIA